MASSPRIVSTTFNRRRQSWSFAEMPLSLYIVPPRAQASRRCETQAPLSGKPPSCAKRFGPLTPSARSGNLIAGDGTKNGLSRSEQGRETRPVNFRFRCYFFTVSRTVSLAPPTALCTLPDAFSGLRFGIAAHLADSLLHCTLYLMSGAHN